MIENLPVSSEAAIDAISKAFAAVFGKPATFISQLISQELARFQLERLAEIAEKLSPLIDAYPGVLEAPEYKFLVPFFQGASLEGDETIQTMWARLYLEECKRTRSEHRVFIDVLKSLSSDDARFFKDRLNLQSGQGYTRHPFENWSMEIRDRMEKLASKRLFLTNADTPSAEFQSQFEA